MELLTITTGDNNKTQVNVPNDKALYRTVMLGGFWETRLGVCLMKSLQTYLIVRGHRSIDEAEDRIMERLKAEEQQCH